MTYEEIDWKTGLRMMRLQNVEVLLSCADIGDLLN